MANLEIAVGGVKMRNPVGVAQLTTMTPLGHIPQRHADFLMRYVEAGAGYVCVPAVVSERKRPKKLDEFKGHVRGAWKVQRVTTKGFATREGLFATASFDMVPNYLDESRAHEPTQAAVARWCTAHSQHGRIRWGGWAEVCKISQDA